MHELRQSFERARRGDFAVRFYEQLLGSDAQVKRKFERTNLARQRELLTHGVYSMLDFAEGKALGKMAMERLSHLHDTKHLDVPPAMYDIWLRAFIETLKKVDPEFTVELEARWREALRPAIELMTRAHKANQATDATASAPPRGR